MPKAIYFVGACARRRSVRNCTTSGALTEVDLWSWSAAGRDLDRRACVQAPGSAQAVLAYVCGSAQILLSAAGMQLGV